MGSLSESLRKLTGDRSITIPLTGKKLRAAKDSGEPQDIVIAPLTAVLTFSEKPDEFKSVLPSFRASAVSLPENWNNYTPQGDSPQKYLLTTRPQNQQKCGSCFAFAAANAISDAFVFGKKLNFNPDISPMSIMSCIKDPQQLQCDGGNPMPVLNKISKEGITTNNCMNYNQICDQYPSCHTLEKKAFDEKNQTAKMIIPPCGCCEEPCSSTNFKYFIDKPVLISVNDAKDGGKVIPGHIDAVELIKQHLYTYGSAVCGFIVYNNFVHDKDSGGFDKTKGIYIESENYIDMEKNKDMKTNQIMGCHAITIVGWGIEKNEIKLEDGTILKETPYWTVRNSWGTKWGLGGYFKMAMYQKVGEKEINPTACLERYHDFMAEGKKYIIGGVILIKPASFQDYKEKSTCKSSTCLTDASPVDNLEYKQYDKEESLQVSNSKSYKSIIIILIILVGLALFYFFYLRKRKGNSKKL
jgi:Papain family cysteine protease